MDRALAVAERQTLIGALERVADRRPGLSVPEVLYTDLSADVPSVLRNHVGTLLTSSNLAAATETCTAVVRLMALQPTRRWLDSGLVLRVALLGHESGGKDVALLSHVRELMAARGRWHAAAVRHSRPVDARVNGDWQFVEELTALPLTFAPMLRSVIARSIIRQDILGARTSLAAYARRQGEAALEARRQLNRHAPSLSALYDAELTPTRRSAHAQTAASPAGRSGARWAGFTIGLLVLCGVAALLIAQPTAAKEQHMGVTQICQITGDVHIGCLTASAMTANLERGDCATASEALVRLEEQLSNFGLNREFAVIRADELGEFREPFDTLQAAYYTHCY